MKSKVALWSLTIILASVCAAIVMGGTWTHRDESDTRQIGWLKWEITEQTSGSILASGDGPILLKDVLISERSNIERHLIDKRIRLTRDFEIQMAEYPTDTPQEKVGFGLVARRTDIQSFSWEWFVIKGANQALKLQEGGELGIDLGRVNDAWEIMRTDFFTDVSLRILRSGLDQPGSPYWRIKVFRGSSIRWPSTVNGEVVIP